MFTRKLHSCNNIYFANFYKAQNVRVWIPHKEGSRKGLEDWMTIHVVGCVRFRLLHLIPPQTIYRPGDWVSERKQVINWNSNSAVCVPKELKSCSNSWMFILDQLPYVILANHLACVDLRTLNCENTILFCLPHMGACLTWDSHCLKNNWGLLRWFSD